MSALSRFVLATGLVLATSISSFAQFFVVPQASVGLPIATAQEYATPRLGYGAQAGYQISKRWSVVAGFDNYRFEVNAPLDELPEVVSILSLFDISDILSVDMQVQVWNAGFRYTLPFRGFIPFIGVSASTNLLEVEGFGLSISRRYWGVSPIVGAELPLADRWSLQADARLQTIFVRDNIPFVQEVVKEHLVFLPLQLGVVFYVSK